MSKMTFPAFVRFSVNESTLLFKKIGHEVGMPMTISVSQLEYNEWRVTVNFENGYKTKVEVRKNYGEIHNSYEILYIQMWYRYGAFKPVTMLDIYQHEFNSFCGEFSRVNFIKRVRKYYPYMTLGSTLEFMVTEFEHIPYRWR